MTKKELEAYKAECEAATEGPWKVNRPECLFPDIKEYSFGCKSGKVGYTCKKPEDTKFIANSRQTVPALIAFIEELVGVVEFYAGNKRAYWIEEQKEVDLRTTTSVFKGKQVVERILKDPIMKYTAWRPSGRLVGDHGTRAQAILDKYRGEE